MDVKEKLTHEQKCQIAAMNANGDTVDDIIKNTGIEKAKVESYVAERNAKNGKRTALTPEIVAQVEDLTRKGWTITDIKAKVGVSPASISRIRTNMKAEKEPAAVATATDSNKDLHENPPIAKDTTFSAECQALRGVEMIGVMQSMLIAAEGDFGNEIDIMALKADSDTASITFRYGGTAYDLSFGLAF